MNESRMLSLDEAADVLKIGRLTLEDLIAQGMLQTAEENGETCVRYEDLVAFLRDDQRDSFADDEFPAD